jgi:hypothetical protein
MLYTTFQNITVCIKTKDDKIIGTGVLLDNKTVLTCWHVVGIKKALNREELKIIFNGNEREFRTAIEIWTPSGEWNYKTDIALIKLDEPFNLGEDIIKWSMNFPRIGNEVVFCGYRANEGFKLGEIVSTHISSYDGQKRECYALKDGCTKGYSGGVVLKKYHERYLAIGLVVANYKDYPNRTWTIPASHINPLLHDYGYKLSVFELESALFKNIAHEYNCYISYLEYLLIKNGLNKSFINISGEAIGAKYNLKNTFSVLDHFISLINNNLHKNKRYCVLGNYGTGKTSLAIYLAYELLKTYNSQLDRIIPIYIPMKLWDKVPSYQRLISVLIDSPNYPFQNRSRLEELLDSKKLLLILDGIDEISNTLDPVTSPNIVQQITSIIPNNTPYIILGRMTFFTSNKSLLSALAISNNDIPPLLMMQLQKENYYTIVLKPLTWPQIEQHIIRKCDSDASFAIKTIRENYDLPDLATRPVLLNIILECINDLKVLIKNKKTITTSDLYETYIHNWLRNPKNRSTLSSDAKLEMLEELSLLLLERNEKAITYSELIHFIKVKLGDEGFTKNFIYDLANCTFLDLTEKFYEFSHKSFLEYFSAKGLARRIWFTDVKDSELFKDHLTNSSSLNEIIDFLRDILFSDIIRKQGSINHLFKWLDSISNYNRSYMGHLLGHILNKLNDKQHFKKLVNAYDNETDPWAKRSLSLACGRIGEIKPYNNFISELLPTEEYRQVNLSYHLEYYCGLENTLFALLSRIIREPSSFLVPIDVFTINQILAKEYPVSQSDHPIINKLFNIFANSKIGKKEVKMIREIGLVKIINKLDYGS